MLFRLCNAETDNNENIPPEQPQKAPLKKKAAGSAKKAAPKRSKFRPPNLPKKSSNDDEIEIFMPGQKPPPSSETVAEPEVEIFAPPRPPVATDSSVSDSMDTMTTQSMSQDSVSAMSISSSSETGADASVPARNNPEHVEVQEFGDDAFKPASAESKYCFFLEKNQWFWNFLVQYFQISFGI